MPEQSPASARADRRDEQRRLVLAECVGFLDGSLADRLVAGYYGEVSVTIKIADGVPVCILTSAPQTLSLIHI